MNGLSSFSSLQQVLFRDLAQLMSSVVLQQSITESMPSKIMSRKTKPCSGTGISKSPPTLLMTVALQGQGFRSEMLQPSGRMLREQGI
ncbi:hypothetical protein FGO68_gene9436 [Halteria grandinella]|uniref:Uncharacterized protein n=1 Tax=Halteria grandinella TaxID=5974 RepID=A0A8J8SX59_HALGN|nr:hypothetical protein FGO68_gene9436 [Halteria grandinella]